METEKDITGELNNYYNSLPNQYQMQSHKQKMSLQQVQDLANCIKVLGNALSFAENYSMMSGNQSKSEFTNYDYFNASKNTEKNLYFKKLAAAINNFDGVYDYYISTYKQEPLPKSLTKKDIINKLETYKKYLKDDSEKFIYDDFINVFSRNSINNVNNVVSNLKGDGTMNPHKIGRTFLNAQGHVQQQNQQVAEEYQNNPEYRPDLVIGAEQPAITNPNVGESQPQQCPDDYRRKYHHP